MGQKKRARKKNFGGKSGLKSGGHCVRVHVYVGRMQRAFEERYTNRLSIVTLAAVPLVAHKNAVQLSSVYLIGSTAVFSGACWTLRPVSAHGRASDLFDGVA